MQRPQLNQSCLSFWLALFRRGANKQMRPNYLIFFRKWISILEQLHLSEKIGCIFCQQLPLGSGSVKSYCAAMSIWGQSVKQAHGTHTIFLHKCVMILQKTNNNVIVLHTHHYFANRHYYFVVAHTQTGTHSCVRKHIR